MSRAINFSTHTLYKKMCFTHIKIMLTIFIRSVVIYLLLLLIMRLMGKRQLSELQPFEFAITLIIAELACIPMSEIQIPLMYGVIPIFTMFVLHLFITKLASKNLKFNRFLNGKPVVVMTPEGIDKRVLDKLDMNVNDLLHALRSAGYFYPEDISYAILETNGKLSVLPKASASPLTPAVENIEVDEAEMPYPVVCEGIIEYTNLELSGVTEDSLKSLLSDNDLKLEDVLLLTINKKKDVFLQPVKGSAITTAIGESK